MKSDELHARATALGLHGVLARWDELADVTWVRELIEMEEAERHRRGLERRLSNAHIGRFKTITDFDWAWPARADRAAIEELFTLGFVTRKENVFLVGPNGIGKTMLAQNLAYTAMLRGHTVRFTTASEMLNDLATQDGARALQSAIRRYSTPQILVVDELGYLSYDNRHADLLFEVVTRRHEQKPIVITTNKPFAEWNEVFPNATCVVTLVDRLVHRSEIVQLDGRSYRLKEAEETAAKKAAARKRG